ncbi:ArsR family transcriptional regulator [Phenylobacterium sp.]|uniref:ArsR family transcriptional regulator n=1 Tax=Phenylobacterium sp. TaxID=1871053 RepID=UPI00374CC9F5
MRQRDCILEAMLAFRALSPRVSVSEIIAFLYTCENEGLSVQELAFITGMSQSAASRNLRALGHADTAWAKPPALGLVEPYLRPSDGRSHVLHLSPEGAKLRDRLDGIIRRGVLIKED